MRKIVLPSVILLFLALSCLSVRAIDEVELIFVGYYIGSTATIGPLSPDTLYVIDLSYPNDTLALGTPLAEVRPSFWNATQAPMYSCNFEVLLSNPLRLVFYSLSGGSYTVKVNGQFVSPPALTVYEVVSTITDYNNLIIENNKLKTDNANLKTENENLKLEIDSLKLSSNQSAYLTLALTAISIVFITSTVYLAVKSSQKKGSTSVSTDVEDLETAI